MRIRTAGAVVASLVAAASALAAGQPAVAAEGNPSSTSAPAAQDNISTQPAVTAEAWQTARSLFGAAATAAQAVASYWTPDRMRSAALVEDSPTYRAAIERHRDSQRQNSSSAQNGPSPSRTRPAGRQHTVQPHRGLLDAQPKPDSHDPEFDSWQPTARTSGKVFFNLAGADYVCSATVVNSEGQNTVWTAGHCVHGGEGGGWATNWQFVPAYNNELPDPRPYDTWFGRQLWTKTSWASSSDISSDMGVAIITPMKSNNSIVGYLGGQGFRTSVGTEVNEDTFGYPSEAPFDGGELYHCKGLTSPEWIALFMWSETLKISCDMTRGASGGAWLHGWDGSWGYLNGINSRIDRIENPTIMMSSYFDDTAWSLYEATRYL